MSVIPFKRILKRGDVGIDVTVVKRALKRAGYGRGIVISRKLGDAAVLDLKKFQKDHGLPDDGVYGPATHLKLAAYIDSYGKLLWNRVAAVPPALATARAMLSYARQFNKPYAWGGEHDGSLADDSPFGYFDCSSSTSLLMYHFGKLGVSAAQVSGWFEKWGEPGPGKYVTVHANGDHVWTSFNLPEGYFRFDTSPHGDGPRGPRVRSSHRNESGFVVRHPVGL